MFYKLKWKSVSLYCVSNLYISCKANDHRMPLAFFPKEKSLLLPFDTNLNENNMREKAWKSLTRESHQERTHF